MPEPTMERKEPTEKERIISEWMSENNVSFGEKFFVYWADDFFELTINEDFSNQYDRLKPHIGSGRNSMNIERAIESEIFRKATQEEVLETYLDIRDILTEEIESRNTRLKEVEQIISSCEKKEA
jgi:hypothetical protein